MYVLFIRAVIINFFLKAGIFTAPAGSASRFKWITKRAGNDGQYTKSKV
jgi:hypothetical protein